MRRLKNRMGMTMAEVLIVVAIIVVLAGVAFIAVNNHQRSLGQLERDSIAKELFVAAQNHLTLAYGEGYLGTTEFGEHNEEDDNEIYFFVVNGSIPDNSVLSQMLPFGSIDETIRAGGSYIIRYQRDSGLVLDVFYCTRFGSPSQFNYTLSEGDYETVLGMRDTQTESKKSERRNWGGHILGWYGGTEASSIPMITLNDPVLEVINSDKLTIKITDTNQDYTQAALRLIITGNESGVSHYFNIYNTPDPNTREYNIVLDEVTSSITNASGLSGGGHFCDRVFDDMIGGAANNGFIPGENLTIQAVAYSATSLGRAYSEATTNSLFADGTDSTTAYISSIRHLENLDKDISKMDTNDGLGDNSKLNIAAAVQTSDLNWTTFSNNAGSYIFKCTTSEAATSNSFYPINPDYGLIYDGQKNSISNVVVNVTGDAGLFGSVSSVSSISNLELIDFSVTGTTSAGALAGSLTGCRVTNVLARNSSNATTVNISASDNSGSVGGLIGKFNGGNVNYSAAALIVSGSGNASTAGGLIGTASGTIMGCYSGGHTSNGAYDGVSFDVTGTIAGGLIGDATRASVENCYSTCSVFGNTAAGLIGKEGTVSGSYCTGLVMGGTVRAFADENTVLDAGNKYYSIINEYYRDIAGNTNREEMKHGGKSTNNQYTVSPIDDYAETYNGFVGAPSTWKNAIPYDPALAKYYNVNGISKYNLQTIEQLENSNWDELTTKKDYFVRTHYGDWPAPEIFIINN